MPPKKRRGLIGRKRPKTKKPAPETATSSPTKPAPQPPNQRCKKSRVPFVSLVGAEQQKCGGKYQYQHAPSKKWEVVELFVGLDEVEEMLLKRAISFTRQRLESAEDSAEEVGLIDITEANQEEVDCKEIIGFAPAPGGAIHTLEKPTKSTVPCATTTETTTAEVTEATETTVEAPAAPPIPPIELYAWKNL